MQRSMPNIIGVGVGARWRDTLQPVVLCGPMHYMHSNAAAEPYQNRRHAIETCAKCSDVRAVMAVPCKPTAAITPSMDTEGN
jgi:hypothetical protein